MNQDPKDFQDIKDNIMTVKGRFKAASQSLFGQFLLIFKTNSNFESYSAVVSTYSDLYNLEPHEDWMKYREYIANVKWKGNFNATMTSSVMDHFKRFSEEMNSITLLYDSICDYDYNAMDTALYDIINRIVHDKNLVIETAIQEITPQDYRAGTSGAEQKEEAGAGAAAPDEGYAVEDDAVILPVKPIVAPVKGKPIYELRVGDRLMVYLQPQSDRANYYIDTLNLREDNGIKPTMGEVIDIKAGSGKNNPTDILTLLAPGIYGKFTETEKQVKLKLYNAETDGPLLKKNTAASASDSQVGSTGMTKGTIAMLVLFMIILALFVVLIFLSW
jgi:hypothetical protein